LLPRTAFAPLINSHATGQRFRTALLASLTLVILLSSGCKSASTPTQPQAPVQAQSQAPEAKPQQAGEQNANTTTSSASGARSDAEMIGDVDAQLDAAIAVFDGMILEERARAEAIEASLGGGGSEGGEPGGAGGGAGGEGSLFEDGDIYEGLPGYGEFPEDADAGEGDGEEVAGEGSEGSSETTASADGSASDNGTARDGDGDSPEGLQTTRRGGIPEDIEGGSDDDIVARQIREAALKEKDPHLREKLWDEYRKYKNQ